MFEVEFKGSIDTALSRLAHAYDLWHPELYLVVADERDRDRAKKLVEPRMRGAFARLRDRLTIMSLDDVLGIHECLSKEKLRELVKQLSGR